MTCREITGGCGNKQLPASTAGRVMMYRGCLRDTVTPLTTPGKRIKQRKAPAGVVELFIQAVGPESLVSYKHFRNRATQHCNLGNFCFLRMLTHESKFRPKYQAVVKVRQFRLQK
jgi:hypothetical protein